MKKLIFIVLSCLTVIACKEEENRKVIAATTPDGISYHYMPIFEEGVTDVTIMAAWPTAWAFEAQNNQAVPYIGAETIISGGTKDLNPGEVQQLFNDKNSRGRVYSNPSHVYGEISFPNNYQDDVLPIVSEMLTHPQFDESWVARTVQSLAANQTEHQKMSAMKMWNASRYAILGDGPINDYLSLHKIDEINKVTAADLQKWHRETFVKSGVTVTIAGAISQREAGKAIDQIFSELPEGPAVKPQIAAPDWTPTQILLHLPDVEKSTIGLVLPLPDTTDGDDILDIIAVSHLGKSPDGPLFEAVRSKLRASYGLQAVYANYDRSNRILFITGEVETEKLAQTIAVVKDTYAKFKQGKNLDGIGEMKQQIADATEKNILYVNVAAQVMLERALDGLDPKDAPDLAKKINAVTVDEIKTRLETKYPDAEALLIFAASPDANALPDACVITKIDEISRCPK